MNIKIVHSLNGIIKAKNLKLSSVLYTLFNDKQNAKETTAICPAVK
ncbi:hypothetical protein [Chryseobacterium sp.]|nr:hypothetical protein [Chryseobacterium sp.]